MLRTIAICTVLGAALTAPSIIAGAEDATTRAQQQVASLMDRLESNALDVREQAARVRGNLRTPQLPSWKLHGDERTHISSE